LSESIFFDLNTNTRRFYTQQNWTSVSV